MKKEEVKSLNYTLCPTVEGAFTLLGKKWVGLILHTLADGELSFAEIERRIPYLSARMLSLRMKELEEEHLVLRTVSAGRPVRVRYQLTEKGKALIPVFDTLVQWAEQWGKK
ncbi:MAG: helix-turn-helix domain-containing protein [Spirochaetales bacterium]